MPEIVAVSDLHLGAPGSLFEVKSVFDRFFDQIDGDPNLQQLILLGDIFEVTLSEKTKYLAEGKKFFQRLGDCGIPNAEIIYIPGNHDYNIWLRSVENMSEAPPFVGTIPGSRIAEDIRNLIPEKLLPRVRMDYPIPPLPLDNGGTLHFHHGHYFDRLICRGIGRAAKKYRDAMVVDGECLPKLEKWFYSNSRSYRQREKLSKTYRLISPFKNAINAILDWSDDWDAPERFNGLSIRHIVNLMGCLNKGRACEVVYGHTHKAGTRPHEETGMLLHNTGGWVIEENLEKPEPALFKSSGSLNEVVPFPVEDEEMKKAHQSVSRHQSV